MHYVHVNFYFNDVNALEHEKATSVLNYNIIFKMDFEEIRKVLK